MSFDDGRDPENIGPHVCVFATPKALKVVPKGGDENEDAFWVPRSVVHADSDVCDDGDAGDLVVQRWFAEKEGLG